MIDHDAETRTWLLSTPTTSYALRLLERDGRGDEIRHVYWGPRLTLAQVAAVPAVADGWDHILGEELTGESGERVGPPALQVRFGDGAGAVQWRYAGHETDDGHLTVRLVDDHYPLELALHYRVRPDTDVIERWVGLRHLGGGDPVTVLRCDSATWTLPVRGGYRLSQVAGEWSAEFQVSRTALPHGETTTVYSGLCKVQTYGPSPRGDHPHQPAGDHPPPGQPVADDRPRRRHRGTRRGVVDGAGLGRHVAAHRPP